MKKGQFAMDCPFFCLNFLGVRAGFRLYLFFKKDTASILNAVPAVFLMSKMITELVQ